MIGKVVTHATGFQNNETSDECLSPSRLGLSAKNTGDLVMYDETACSISFFKIIPRISERPSLPFARLKKNRHNLPLRHGIRSQTKIDTR